MRDIPVGNGTLLVNFDDKYQIRDIYFPHVGQENHTEGFPFRFGVWIDGKFSWIFADGWTRRLSYEPETLVTDVTLENKELAIRLKCSDTVASHDNIFLRRVEVSNLSSSARQIRVFLHQDFRIYENKVGDTAYFDPDTKALVHYKKHRYFLINTEPAFDSFATGRKAFRDQEGTWRDAEDGELSRGVVTEGSVDSTLAVYLQIKGGATGEFFYWIAAGFSYAEVRDLNAHVQHRRPERYLNYTGNYWRAWVNKNDRDFEGLPPEVVDLYKRSLLIARTQIDNHGAVLAANDSDVAERATDHYSYLWTRDGALVANALDTAGYADIARRFYEFCARIIHPNGYFLQKYNADGTVASGWHAAWDARDRTPMVPIQEDETALVVWALWQHYHRYRDIEFVHRLYRTVVVPSSDFMSEFRHKETGLPAPSWNLWEDRRGIHTFTCSAVVGALWAATEFATLFAEKERAAKYEQAGKEIVAAMGKHLYSAQEGRFLRSLQFLDNDSYTPDPTVDASLFGTFYFGAFAASDPRVEGTMAAVEDRLSVKGGIARFEDDPYMRVSPGVTGNAWLICTLWLAEYFIASARTAADLDKPRKMLSDITRLAHPSGVLPEQIDPVTGAYASVSPLTWSHSTYVAAVESYLRRLAELK
ncbi:MAG TPA: glycoside hydrolase family 15 protein [Pyrinomonadaceae bacterium]|nr:glycoside hydrolase family 15 protein [Pyrinomonadaceae bacterium]